MRTFDLWPLDLVESTIHGLHSLRQQEWQKVHKIVDFWWFIPQWETKIGNFFAKLMESSCSVSFLMKWGCWGHWGHWGHWGCWGHWGRWGSWCQGNHSICLVQAFILRKKAKTSQKCWKMKLKVSLHYVHSNSLLHTCFAPIQDWGCGGQGCYFQPNPSVISQMSISHERTDTVFMT